MSRPKELRLWLTVQSMCFRIWHNLVDFVWCRLHFFKLWCKEQFIDIRKLSMVSEEIRLAKPYTTSKAYYQTAFGLRTLYSCLLSDDTVKMPSSFNKSVFTKIFFETILLRNFKMHIVSWNVQGTKKSQVLQEILFLKRTHKPQIVFFIGNIS